MELTSRLLKELQNRLKVGNRRGVHLNAIPRNSRYKFDLNKLSAIRDDLPQEFISDLLTTQPLKFEVSWKQTKKDINSLLLEDQVQLVKISKSFENLINQTQAIESEKGINTFGFGFPLLIRRDKADNKLTVAPILIWSLRIQRQKEFNTWKIVRTEDDPIYVNEVLINHINSDSGLRIDPISSEMLEDGLIDKKELLEICSDLIKTINTNVDKDIVDHFRSRLDQVKSISDKKHYESLISDSFNSMVEFGGLFSIFEVQKQNIIDDYGDLLDLKNLSLDLEDMDSHSFQPLSSVETDPSQQGILHALQTTRNVVIQGPPGTGKSQSLTAILVNALENRKRTIVVCEKKTALEVLHEALKERGLDSHCILIKDSVKDRKLVVNSVRSRLESVIDRDWNESNAQLSLERIVNKSKRLIEQINKQHKKVGSKIYRSHNWPDTVGILLSKLKTEGEDDKLDIDKTIFTFDPEELDVILQLADEGQELFEQFVQFKGLSILNHNKLTGDSAYEVEEQIKSAFQHYSEEFNGRDSRINNIREKYDDGSILYDLESTSGLGFKLSALFSKRKRQLVLDKNEFIELCNRLADQINNDGWIKDKIDKSTTKRIIEDITTVLDSINLYFNDDRDPFSSEFRWFKYYNAQDDFGKRILDSLEHKKDWKRVLIIFYLKTLLSKSHTDELPITDKKHKDLGASLEQIGEHQIRFIDEYWHLNRRAARKDFIARNPNLTVENLYNKRSSQRHKRLSLRQIVKYDPELFTSFFPVILTTPDVCSNLFKGMNKYFDIVLFDEASQLRLEDNLPALLKGKQVVIAGDEHQMPPSNYFSKVFDGSIEDEEDFEEEEDMELSADDFLLSCESLLEFASELNFEKRFLDFHYRSKHPYLIDFSNHAFYNKRLRPLPNRFEYVPISYLHIDGTFSDHCNEQEAEAVLSILEHNINRLPDGEYPSVGVATFNISQRNLILSKILERRQLDRFEDFNEKMLELEEAGFFVKNLENIQGDERDVIILSTTYGPNKEGRFFQRFGPVNQTKGYKLLNVIITRAKYKVYVCTSIPETEINNYKHYLETEGSNNRKAVFFAYLAYAKAVSDSNEESKNAVLATLSENSTVSTNIDFVDAQLESPFEEEVYQVLLEKFDQDKLIPQLQFAGFRIDIVYDPKIEGIPKIAIECDGAAYHSSREAYLYDHHRQKILEGHGFVFHRIWSTNWWRNHDKESKKLFDFIKSIESKKPKKTELTENVGMAFTNDFKLTGLPSHEQNATGDSELNEQDDSLLASLENPTEVQKRVSDSSKVTIRYINTGESITLVITEPGSAVINASNDVRHVNSNSPLALSIIGRTVGETVKVGGLDNYVEILEIDN